MKHASVLQCEVVYVTIRGPAFCLALYLAVVHFQSKLQHVGHVGEQKIKCRPIRTQEIAGFRLYNKLYDIERHSQWSKSGIELKLKKVVLLFQKTTIMNNYFANITTQLKLKSTKIDPKADLESIIHTFQNHKSPQRIEVANFHSKSSLKLNSVSELDIKKEILKYYQRR